jgi:hypothetical protein
MRVEELQFQCVALLGHGARERKSLRDAVARVALVNDATLVIRVRAVHIEVTGANAASFLTICTGPRGLFCKPHRSRASDRSLCMALRSTTKIRGKESEPIEYAPLVVDQRKQPDARYRLQVDRQTKRSFLTLDEAAAAGLVIKQAHPIVQVSVYDAIDCVNQMVGLDGLIPAPSVSE